MPEATMSLYRTGKARFKNIHVHTGGNDYAVPQKKSTTSNADSKTSEQAPPQLPEQEEFRQHLRRLAVSAVQVLIEQVMLEELEQCIPRVAQRDFVHGATLVGTRTVKTCELLSVHTHDMGEASACQNILDLAWFYEMPSPH